MAHLLLQQAELGYVHRLLHLPQLSLSVRKLGLVHLVPVQQQLLLATPLVHEFSSAQLQVLPHLAPPYEVAPANLQSSIRCSHSATDKHSIRLTQLVSIIQSKSANQTMLKTNDDRTT